MKRKTTKSIILMAITLSLGCMGYGQWLTNSVIRNDAVPNKCNKWKWKKRDIDWKEKGGSYERNYSSRGGWNKALSFDNGNKQAAITSVW